MSNPANPALTFSKLKIAYGQDDRVAGKHGDK